MNRQTSSFRDLVKDIKINSLQFLGPLVILLVCVSWITIVFQKTVFDDTNYIHHFQYTQQNIEEYDNPYLYREIEDILTGKNVYKLNYFWIHGVLSKLHSKFAMVHDLSVSKLSANTVAVKLTYTPPQIVFTLPVQERKFGIWWDQIVEIFSGNTLADNILDIHLPLYTSGLQNINWIFFDIPAKKLLPELYYIHKMFPQAERIVYMPWSQTTVVFVYKKKVFINHTHDIEQQIKTFYALDNYYTGFVHYHIVDLGSLEEWEAIVR